MDIIGERPERIYIEFSNARLATLGITAQQIFQSLARQNAVDSGRRHRHQGGPDQPVRLTGAFTGVDAIARGTVAAGSAVFPPR